MSTDIRRALDEGERRSREASLLRRGDTHAMPPAPRVILTPELIWRRYKWPIIGFGMFLLIELLGLGSFAGARGHF